jgi:hypothetical protein
MRVCGEMQVARVFGRETCISPWLRYSRPRSAAMLPGSLPEEERHRPRGALLLWLVALCSLWE